jgi:hypothetical protein
VENRYELKSKGKAMMDNVDRLQDKGKPILDKANWLPDKSEPELGNPDGSQDKAKPTSDKEAKEESVMKKREFEKVESPLDNETTKPIRVDDLAKDGDMVWEDWRLPLMECIRNLSKITNKKLKRQILKYTLLDDDLYRRTIDDVLVKCLGDEQAKEAVREVHDGICGAHQSAYKMKWLLRRAGFYWPTMVDDCIKYEKGCEVCQWFWNIQLAPAGVMNSIVKPWPFRGWGLEFIGEIHPGSSKGHQFILVATDYFTKWAEAVPLRNMTHREVISFVQKHIIYQFGVAQTLVIDQGPSFMSHQFKEFVVSMKIKLMNSSPYYAQANGQTEASNKVLIEINKKRIEGSPRRWLGKLSEALWARKTSRHGATKGTPFELAYGQEVVLPVEVSLQNLRVTGQTHL